MYFADSYNDLPSELLKKQIYIGVEKLWKAGIRFQVFSIYCDRPLINKFVDALCQIRLLKKYIGQSENGCCLHEDNCNDIINKDNLVYTILLENAESLGQSLDNIRLFTEQGVKIIGLTGNSFNGYCGNRNDSERLGLTPHGRELIRQLNQHKVVVDLTDASSIAYSQACELSEFPCMVSHSDVYSGRAFIHNLSDDNMRLLKESGGYIGLRFYGPFLGRRDDIEPLFRYIDYCMELGCENILGFGFNFNGVPNAYSDIVLRMIKAGYKREVIEKIAHDNLINYLKKFN